MEANPLFMNAFHIAPNKYFFHSFLKTQTCHLIQIFFQKQLPNLVMNKSNNQGNINKSGN